MSRLFFFLTGYLFFATSMCAQLSIHAGGSYLQSDNWDKTVQTYNLTTTWEAEEIKPLDYGWYAGAGYSILLFNKPQVYLVPQIRYTHWGSQQGAMRLALHQLSIGPEIRFNPRALLFGIESAGPIGPRWYMAAQPGLQCWMPRVKRNGTWTTYDSETPYRPLTARFDLKLSTGFHAMTIGQWIVTPEMSAQLIKGTELFDWTEQILGHNIVGLNNTLNKGWNWSIGLVLTRMKKSTEWWDRPRAK
jgi:hypothetical protein